MRVKLARLCLRDELSCHLFPLLHHDACPPTNTRRACVTRDFRCADTLIQACLTPAVLPAAGIKRFTEGN